MQLNDVGFLLLDLRPSWSLMRDEVGFTMTLERGLMNMEFTMLWPLAKPMSNWLLSRGDMLSFERPLKFFWPTTALVARRPSNRLWPTSCLRSTTTHRLQGFLLLSGSLDKHQIFLANYLELHSLQFTLVNLLKMNLPGEPRREWPSFRPTRIKSSEEPC